MVFIDGLLILLLAYVGIGLAFAVHFLLRLAPQIDESTVGASRGFKLIVLPGVVALWPVLAAKVHRSRGGA